MERIWLKHYPPGIAAEIDPSRYASLVDMLEETFAKYRERTAFICMGKKATYGEIDEMSRALGGWLQSRGMAKGARVAIMMPNVLQYPVATCAVLRAGFTVVNTNPLYTAFELENQLKDAGAEAIIVLENFAHTLQHTIGKTDIKHVVVASMGDLLGMMKGTIVNLVVRRMKKMVPTYLLPDATPFNAAVAAGKSMTLIRPQLGPDDLAFLQYTGGTTGVPKGAMLLQRNLVANILQLDEWLKPVLEKEPKVDRLTVVAALPLYHIFALTGCFLLSVRTGGQCILIANPRDIPNLIKELSKHRVNHFPAVNTLYNALLNLRISPRSTGACSNASSAAVWRCKSLWRTAGSRQPARH